MIPTPSPPTRSPNRSSPSTPQTPRSSAFRPHGRHPDGLVGFSGGDCAALDVAGVYGNPTRSKRIVFMREGYQMLNRLVDRDDLPACIMLTVLDASRERSTR